MMVLLYLLGMEEVRMGLRGTYNLHFPYQVLQSLLFKSPSLITFSFSSSHALTQMSLTFKSCGRLGSCPLFSNNNNKLLKQSTSVSSFTINTHLLLLLHTLFFHLFFSFFLRHITYFLPSHCKNTS